MTMNNDELARFLGIKDEPKCTAVIAALSPEKRALFNRMAEIEIAAALWMEGLGPKPSGVLIDTVRDTSRRRSWR
jgi:hypothetical protein